MDSDSEFPKSSSSEAMFFSPRLLQRKTPMGRLWMAGTVGRKLSPRVLAKLNISALSELITNQPTAIRIPAILLKGLVSIFAMKVDIVLKDAESVWVTMAEHDPGPRVSNGINMARNRALARYEAVTLPQGVLVSQLNVVNHHANKLLFAKPPASSTWTFTMDDIPSSFISVDITDDMHHQAQKANITLDDDRSRMAQITDYVVEPDRIEISQETADELIHKVEAPFLPTCPGAREPPEPQVQPVTEVNPDTRIYLASSSVPVAAHHHGYFIAGKIMDEPKQDPPAVASNVIIDDQRLIIPAEVYKGWIRDTSDIVKERRTMSAKLRYFKEVIMQRKNEVNNLAKHPLVCASDSLTGERFYPPSLLKLWTPSENSSAALPPSRNLISPPLQHRRPHEIEEMPEHIVMDPPPLPFQHPNFTSPPASPAHEIVEVPENIIMDPPLVMDFLNFLQHLFKTHDPTFNVHDVASEMGMKKSQAARLFYEICNHACKKVIEVHQERNETTHAVGDIRVIRGINWKADE